MDFIICKFNFLFSFVCIKVSLKYMVIIISIHDAVGTPNTLYIQA